jgi:hypothetical protein
VDFELAYQRLASATEVQSPQIAREIADECGDALLTATSMPDAYIDFVCCVLSDSVVGDKPGLIDLVVMLYLERDKLSENQLDRVFACLEGSFRNISNEDLAYGAGDFIARVATPERCLKLLLGMNAKATSRQAFSGVFLGFDILRKYPGELSPETINAAEAAADERAAQLEGKRSAE